MSEINTTPAGEVYEVFARIKKDDPHRHIGSVIAPEADLAKMYAFTLYNEWNWDHMFVVRRADIRTLIAPK